MNVVVKVYWWGIDFGLNLYKTNIRYHFCKNSQHTLRWIRFLYDTSLVISRFFVCVSMDFLLLLFAKLTTSVIGFRMPFTAITLTNLDDELSTSIK